MGDGAVLAAAGIAISRSSANDGVPCHTRCVWLRRTASGTGCSCTSSMARNASSKERGTIATPLPADTQASIAW